MRVFDQYYETMPRPQLEQLQLERLQSLLVRLRRNVRRYREQIADVTVESLDDLARLPLTSPEQIAKSFPYGMFALPLREVIRLHSTLGPEGTPLVIGHSRNDLNQWGRLVARQLVASGATANDVVQTCLGGASYRGGAGYVLGAELIEASVVAEEPFHIASQLAMLQNYRPTMLITAPTNALELMRAMDSRRIDPPSLHLRNILLSRPVDAATLELLRSGFLVAVQSNFGIDEILDPGFCIECEQGQFHVNEDQFLVEAVEGELVVTTLCREAIPLLRYATRIACEIAPDKCPCGRTGAILKPGRRLDGRLRVGETPLYEQQITALLNQGPAAGNRFSLEVTERQVVIYLEVTTKIFSDIIWPIENLRHEIESEFLERLGVEAEVHFVSGGRK